MRKQKSRRDSARQQPLRLLPCDMVDAAALRDLARLLETKGVLFDLIPVGQT
jgi:hypothetical protein